METLVIDPLHSTDRGAYAVVASNAYGSITSSIVVVCFASPPSEAVGEAVDLPGLTWTLTGSMNWFLQSANTFDQVDAVQSPSLKANQSASFSTTNSGPGAVFFSWSVSSRTNAHYLSFLVDGSGRANISGDVDWRRFSVALAPGPHTLTWRYQKNSIAAAGQDSGWVDAVTFDAPVLGPVTISPAGATVTAGSLFYFVAQGSGTEPLSYQWQCNGTNLPEQYNNSLLIRSTQLTDAGNYSVVVTNGAGSVSSAMAPLVVLPPGVTTHPWLVPGSEGNVQVAWSLGTLETAASLDGPWVEMRDAVSPYAVPLQGSARFWRVRLK
jgi:hypothetical protein